jgi:hypothetical protein
MTVPSELNAIAITILMDNDFCKKLVYKFAIGLHVEDDTLMSHLPILDLEVYDHPIVDIDLSWNLIQEDRLYVEKNILMIHKK